MADPILFDQTNGEWSHRYGPATDEYWPYGTTACCERPIYVPTEVYRSAVPVAPPSLLLTDCCDRPFAVYGPKPVELPPYSGEYATCRKCGSKAVETKFTTARDVPFGIPRAGYPAEWLHRRCAVCQAEWDEATVTARDAAAAAAAEPTPHNAAPWSVWGIGDTWWVHHAPSGMFLPVDRGSTDTLTPAEMAEAWARLLGKGDGAEFMPQPKEPQPGRWPQDEQMPTCTDAGAHWYHRQALEEYAGEFDVQRTAPEERRVGTYGLRHPGIHHQPYVTVGAAYATVAREVLTSRQVFPITSGTEFVRRRSESDPWEVLLVADGDGHWVDADGAKLTTITSEPNAALYLLCLLRHPLACRLTLKDGRPVGYDIVCPTCERDGTVGVIVLGSADG